MTQTTGTCTTFLFLLFVSVSGARATTTWQDATTTWQDDNWFERVFGFQEEGYEQVRDCFRVEQNEWDGAVTLHTRQVAASDGSTTRTFYVGKFDTPSVQELARMLERTRLPSAVCREDDIIVQQNRLLTFSHLLGDIGAMHRDPGNAGAVFQAASQFNCLEMTSPSVTPSMGITIYSRDKTQGPACALACPAGTLYRNYFVNGTGQGGGYKQLDLLQDVGEILGNWVNIDGSTSPKPRYWKMKNGYALAATRTSISQLREKLDADSGLGASAVEQMRVGVHWGTEVYRGEGMPSQNVTQVYCSALPIRYDHTAANRDWEPFARVVLEGTYQATLTVAAILAQQRQGRVTVFLTKVGGGVFGNSPFWVSDAISNALHKFQAEPLDVRLVHFGHQEQHYLKQLPPMLGP